MDAKSQPPKRCSGLSFGTIFGDMSQSEKLSEIKPTLEGSPKDGGILEAS